MRIAYEVLVNTCSKILIGIGVPEQEASLQATVLVEAEARRHPSHGVQRLPVVVDRVRAGLAVGDPEVAFDWLGPGALRVDGGRGLGPVVAMRAIDAIGRVAATDGIAVAAVRNSNHVGMLSVYVEELARRGLVGLALTTSEPLVHPWGGRQAMIGTNPIAIAVPATPAPLVFDMATSAVSMGKIIDHGLGGRDLEPGWALDEEGHPTLDAERARRGSIAPFGGPKGFALGVALEALIGALTGCALGTDVTGTLDAETVCNKGDVFMALDPRRFGVADAEEHVGEFLGALRGSPAQSPEAPVRAPGDRARASRRDALDNGVLVDAAVWDDLQRRVQGIT